MSIWKILTFIAGFIILVVGVAESNWVRTIGGLGLLLIFVFME